MNISGYEQTIVGKDGEIGCETSESNLQEYCWPPRNETETEHF